MIANFHSYLLPIGLLFASTTTLSAEAKPIVPAAAPDSADASSSGGGYPITVQFRHGWAQRRIVILVNAEETEEALENEFQWALFGHHNLESNAPIYDISIVDESVPSYCGIRLNSGQSSRWLPQWFPGQTQTSDGQGGVIAKDPTFKKFHPLAGPTNNAKYIWCGSNGGTAMENFDSRVP